MTSVQNHQQRLSGSNFTLLLIIAIFASSCGLFNKARDNGKDKVIDDKVTEKLDTLDLVEIDDEDLPPIIKDSLNKDIGVDLTSYKKEEYTISMMIPFDAADAQYDVNDPSDEKFVNYYAGVKLALDEFQNESARFRIRSFDSKRDSGIISQKLRNGDLDNSDVIIGPYDRDGLSMTATFGKERAVAVVSPWLASTRITDDNPFYIQLRPSLSSHYFKLIEHAAENYAFDEIILVGKDSDSDRNRFKYFQKTYAALTEFAASEPLKEVFLDEQELITAEFVFGDLFAEGGRKAIIIPNWNYNDEDFIYGVLRRLNIERAQSRISVYGMPILYDSEKIDFDFYKNLNIRICLSEFVDWEEDRVKAFMQKFHNTYGALPTSDAFEGYDMMKFIGNNLIKYGMNFQLKLEDDRNRYLQTSYDIQKIYDEEDEKFEHIKYLENKHLDLIQFREGKFLKID